MFIMLGSKDYKASMRISREWPKGYTDRDTRVIKKELAEGQLKQIHDKHNK